MSSSRRDARYRGKAGDIGHPDRVRGGGDPVGSGLVASFSRPVATSPACRLSRPTLPANGLNSCAKLFPVFAGWQSMADAGDPVAVLEMGEVQVAARTLGLEAVEEKSDELKISRPPCYAQWPC